MAGGGVNPSKSSSRGCPFFLGAAASCLDCSRTRFKISSSDSGVGSIADILKAFAMANSSSSVPLYGNVVL